MASETPAAKALLVVDDDPSYRAGVAVALQREGYGVLQAANDQEALDRVQGDPVGSGQGDATPRHVGLHRGLTYRPTCGPLDAENPIQPRPGSIRYSPGRRIDDEAFPAPFHAGG